MKKLFLAAAMAAGAVLLAGCSGPAATDTTTPDAGTSAPAQTAAPTDAASPTAAATTAAPAPGGDDFTGRTPKPFKTFRFTMTTDATAVEGAIDQTDPAAPKWQVTTEVSGQKIEMILLDGKGYVKTPGADQWIAMDASQLQSQMPFSDPTEGLQEAASQVENVTNLGTETIDGVETTHFQFVANGATTDVWLDGDNRPRKSVVDSDQATVTITMGNFDEPVDIQVPDNVMGG